VTTELASSRDLGGGKIPPSFYNQLTASLEKALEKIKPHLCGVCLVVAFMGLFTLFSVWNPEEDENENATKKRSFANTKKEAPITISLSRYSFETDLFLLTPELKFLSSLIQQSLKFLSSAHFSLIFAFEPLSKRKFSPTRYHFSHKEKSLLFEYIGKSQRSFVLSLAFILNLKESFYLIFKVYPQLRNLNWRK
jgi:hypothetical protein